MAKDLAKRKREHLRLCLTDKVIFREKSAGFEYYDFIHNAATTVLMENINLTSKFLGHQTAFPFMISCMTGGTDDTNNINKKLAIAANLLNIPLGLGSLRYALKTNEFDNIFTEIRKLAPNVPIIGNIGIAQVCRKEGFEKLSILVKQIRMSTIAVHFNPLQELFQKHGEWNFENLYESFSAFVRHIGIPVIAKEVGSGISGSVAQTLLKRGAIGIDVAGAGGTSWAGVEFLRNKKNDKESEFFWDWGLPTSFCIKQVKKIKKKTDFLLIGSGGVNDAYSAAKTLALGADFAASARSVLLNLEKGGPEAVVKQFTEWGDILRKIMYLTGSQTIPEFQKKKLIRREKLY